MRFAKLGTRSSAGLLVILLVFLLLRRGTGDSTFEFEVGAAKKAAEAAAAPVAAAARKFDDQKLEFPPIQEARASVTIDATKHCVPLSGDDKAGQSVVRVLLERGVRYTVTARG